MGAILKYYYPAVLWLFGGLKSQIALDFLLRFPTQDQMKALSERRFCGWLKDHHYPCPQRLDDMVDILKRPALSVAEHLQKSKKPLVCYLAGSIKMLNAEIAESDKQITEQLNELPEANWIRSLPGAGDVPAPSLSEDIC